MFDKGSCKTQSHAEEPLWSSQGQTDTSCSLSVYKCVLTTGKIHMGEGNEGIREQRWEKNIWGGGMVSHRSCQTVWLLLSIKVWQSHQGSVSQRSVRHPPAEQLACRPPVTHVEAVTYSHHQNGELLNWQVTLETTLNASSDKARGNWSLSPVMGLVAQQMPTRLSELKIKYLHLEA